MKMKTIIDGIKRIRLTPVVVYTILLIVDNTIYLPFWYPFNRGAIDNVLSLFIIAVSIIILIVEIVELFILKVDVYNKKVFIKELIYLGLFTFSFWLIMSFLPFPSLRFIGSLVDYSNLPIF